MTGGARRHDQTLQIFGQIETTVQFPKQQGGLQSSAVVVIVLVLEGGCGCATNCGCDGGCVGEVSASDRGRGGVCDGLRSVRLALSTWISSGVDLVDVPLPGAFDEGYGMTPR